MTMKFLHTVFWEFVQNLPLIVGFVVGVSLWRQSLLAAVVCMVAGSVAGSLVIGFTESKIVDGHREPMRLIATNTVSMSLLMLVMSAYLSVGWSSWKTDLILGPTGGVLLGIIQSLAEGAPIGVVHCMAFGVSFPLGLVGVRELFAAELSLILTTVVITGAVTVVVCLFDYLRQEGYDVC